MFGTLVNVGVAVGATWLVSKTDTKLGRVSSDILNVASKSLDLVSAATGSISSSVDEITAELTPKPSRKASKGE